MLERLKWVATGCLVIGFGLVSAGLSEFIWLQLAGGGLWLAAALYMRDRPLIVTNAVMTLAGLLGLLYRVL